MPRSPAAATPKPAVVTAEIFKRWMHWCVQVPKRAFKVNPPIVPLPVVVDLGKGDRFESTLSSQSPEAYVLVIPVAFLRDRGLSTGDSITLRLEPELSRTAPQPPSDFLAYLRAQPALAAEYAKMTVASQRQVVKYVDGAVNELSRQSRFERMGERLRDRIERRKRKVRN